MIRLNLGCGGPGLLSWHPIDGWINRDPDLDGWRFEHGLGEYADGSVEAISISHAAMYLPLDQWPVFFADCARVLCDEGVLRITEDDTSDTRSRTYPNGWMGSAPRVTLTNPETTKRILREVGLIAEDCDATHTNFRDKSILQDQHGGAPHVFYCEGRRMTRAFFTAHPDDEVLFGAFTLLRYRPHLVICFPSPPEYGDTAAREKESFEAGNVLGVRSVQQWGGDDLVTRMREFDSTVKPSRVFAPDPRTSHPEHRAVAEAAIEVFAGRLTTYHTYDDAGKVRSEREAPFEPAWVLAKLRALARFETQATHPRAHRFFMWDHFEFLGDDR